jgi:Mg2+ and Co2+ transporter CorA
MRKYVFFLGGYDAEMAEIRNILQSRNERFFDKKLSWGAVMSSYKEEITKLSSDAIPVFIELKQDCPYPENSKFIDHHDEMADKCQKTSIEHVADLLDIELNRRQLLISANDRGHIRAMKEMCATDEDIRDIRAMDRKAQGVTEEDERLAEESIEKHLEKIKDDAVIIHSLTNKTSPVFDRLYDKYRHIFVFTPDGEMNYSGAGEIVLRLVDIYKEEKKTNPSIEFWYGGNLPDNGFFGTKTPLDKEEIKEMIKKIISQHIFMFPFRIALNEEEKKNGNPEINIRDVFKLFKDSGWEYKPYKVDTPAHYSECYYFHEYVRKAIFESRDLNKIEELFTENRNPDVISYYFERPVDDDAMMTIRIRKEVNGKQECREFELKIHHLSLRLFSIDIGILTIELLNYGYPSLQDVMHINEYGRRIYPQFLPDNCDISVVKNNFLADRIEFKCGNIDSTENFCPITKYFNGKLVVADYITKLFGDGFTKRYNFIPIIDDRMFTVCWYANADLIKELQKEVCFTGNYRYETSDKWYSFVFIDGSVSGVSAGGKMKEDLIKQFTYSRWIHTGTLYGITRYSLMCLTNSSFDVLRHHMERMYYQIAIILLAQRASILKFSDDVSRISGDIERLKKGEDEQKRFKEIAEKVKNLHSSFIHFVNRLWFTEVTPQEQGIEMYNMAVKNMGLTEQLNELRHEIKELYEFVEMEYEKEINRSIALLDKIAFSLLPLIVASSLLGMNIYSADEVPYGWYGRIGLFVLLGACFYCIAFFFKWLSRKRWGKKWN